MAETTVSEIVHIIRSLDINGVELRVERRTNRGEGQQGYTGVAPNRYTQDYRVVYGTFVGPWEKEFSRNPFDNDCVNAIAEIAKQHGVLLYGLRDHVVCNDWIGPPAAAGSPLLFLDGQPLYIRRPEHPPRGSRGRSRNQHVVWGDEHGPESHSGIADLLIHDGQPLYWISRDPQVLGRTPPHCHIIQANRTVATYNTHRLEHFQVANGTILFAYHEWCTNLNLVVCDGKIYGRDQDSEDIASRDYSWLTVVGGRPFFGYRVMRPGETKYDSSVECTRVQWGHWRGPEADYVDWVNLVLHEKPVFTINPHRGKSQVFWGEECSPHYDCIMDLYINNNAIEFTAMRDGELLFVQWSTT